MNYGSLLTITGQNKIAAALQPGGAPLTITHIALGDGGGAAVVPSENRAALLNEVHRQTIDSSEPHPTDPTSFLIQSVIPPNVGGFWIREIGLYDADGDLVVYGNYPETAKPLLTEGAGNELIIRTYLAVSSTDAVTIQVDPSFVGATQAWVNMQLIWNKIGEKPETATRWPKWDEVSEKPTEFPPSAHQHPWTDINQKPATATRWPKWGEVTEKPDTFPASSHTHNADDVNAGVLAVARIPKLAMSKINGLSDALDDKANINHTHTTADIVDVHRARRFFFNQL